MDVRLDVKALMQDMGEKARAAASELAFAPAGQKDAALRAAADAIWSRREALLAANAADMAGAEGLGAAMLDRLALTEPRVAGMVEGLRAIADQPDPVGSGHCGMGPAVRSAHPQGAHAPGRGGRDLREPAERDGGRRRAVPQGGKRRDPSRRFGKPALGAADPRRAGGGARGGRASRSGDPARADHGPRGRGRDADHDALHRRAGAARRQGAGRAGAGGGAGSGLRASGRDRAHLRRPGGGHGEGPSRDPERQDPAHGGVRRGRMPADRPGVLRGGRRAVHHRPGGGGGGGSRRRRTARTARSRAGRQGRLGARVPRHDHRGAAWSTAWTARSRISAATARSTPTAS